ncbi:nitric oxide reductase activation protein NorD [Bradyrhizobium sp. HKCCYLS1011]|uniref:nitric oxide reductase activation protein NorD n=1 Tax=Bradyrhizobium sp. HKCCYLS1011 TaxID=3420733 RepID=UPI003EBD055B
MPAVSAAKPPIALKLLVEPGGDTRPLHLLMRQRDSLWPLFLSTWEMLSRQFQPPELEAWAGAVLKLAHVNAGPSCLLAYWEASTAGAMSGEIAPLLGAAQASVEICRNAGAQAATGALKALPAARRVLGHGAPLSRWWRAMERLAQQAPESVVPMAGQMGEILRPGTIEAFENFVAAGLRAAAGDRRKRIAFFSLQDELARRLITRDPVAVTFTDIEHELKAFLTALWGEVPLLRSMALEDGGQQPQRRAAIAGPLIRLPEIYRGMQRDAARALFQAAAAHAQAHLALGRARFPIGQLKPLQVTLVGLIEDARVEALAMRALPGLRRLWAPYHVAVPTAIATAPMLLARLARALFDPAYVDDDGFVSKGRALFTAALLRINESAISREIGMLLGNDLGQMRVQFNAKTYVVEPLYRDDGLGLWDFGDHTPPSADVLELFIDAVRQQREDDEGPRQEHDPGETTPEPGKARPVAPNERGVIIARYPEWDRVDAIERTNWTTVREVAAHAGDARSIEDALDRAGALRSRVARLVRGVRIGRTVRLKRQQDGHDLDLDAVLDAAIALRGREKPDLRVFRATKAMHRDLSALLLIDTSESTHDRLASGATILDVERLAVALLAEAMNQLGDTFGLLAFASDGREDVRMTNIKGFDEPYDTDCRARLAGLTSGLSTRLGTALRHAGSVVGQTTTSRKLLIVLTDGEPSDVDVSDPLDLIEDARRAAVGLHAAGIDAYGVVLGRAGSEAAARIFGRGNTMLVHRVEDLPARLSELYFRLARR